MKVELISLLGINPEFEERTPPDLGSIKQKSFSIKFDKLNCAKQFKHVWDSNQPLLENVLANKNSKKGFQDAKKLAVDQMFSEKVKVELENKMKNDKKTMLKPRR